MHIGTEDQVNPTVVSGREDSSEMHGFHMFLEVHDIATH